MGSGITVVIPSIPPRRELLVERALCSVQAQTLLPDDIVVAFDNDKLGAGPTRSRGLAKATTEWVAFMDDDDELLPHHLATLHAHALATGADVVWPWYEVWPQGNPDPFPPHFFGLQWDPAGPHSFPITTLVRREAIGDLTFAPPASAHCANEDWTFWLAMNERGAQFSHVAERTWRWWMGVNTSGSPSRW